MATPNFVVDNEILWLEVPKSGNPPQWSPDTNYRLGDVVIPRSSFVIPNGKENVMFQCVGFVAKSGNVEPTFPTNLGDVVVDGTAEWIARNPTPESVSTRWNEYYQITQSLILE